MSNTTSDTYNGKNNVTNNAISNSKRILLVCRHGPYGTSLARESVETALAAGAMGTSITMLFINDGVWQLLAHQQSEKLTAKNHSSMLSALPLYGVENLLVDQQSLIERGINSRDLSNLTKVIDNIRVERIFADCEVILSF